MDTTPPVVVSIVPGQHYDGVALDAAVTITFNEAMNQTSHTGQITMSSGTITAMTWTTAQVLTVTHGGWDEGTAVTVTVGTGLRDVAGNQLANPVSVTFYTMSSELVFLASIPAHGSIDVNRSSRVDLLFSAPMDIDSLADHLTLRAGHLPLRDDEPDELPFTVDDGDGNWVRVTPDDDLPGSATITLTVAAGAQDQGGRPLAEPVSISFTTSDEIDTTPPTILSFEPASGTMIPATTSALIITFSEPMDPNSLVPSEMGAELWLLIYSQGADPIWSQNYTVLTVGLPAPLPAGMPLWATFAGYADANGNVQHEETHWSVVVVGAADYYPVVGGRELVYIGTWEEGEEGETDPTDWGTRTDYLRFELQPGGIFHLVEYEYEDYQDANHTQIMSRTDTALLMHGWIDHKEDGDQHVDFNVPLTYLSLPPVQGQPWSGSTDSPQQPDYTLTISGEWLERLDRLAVNSRKSGPAFFWTNVWKVRLEFSMSYDGDVLFSGFDEMYLAPGVGLVRRFEEGVGPDGGWDRSDVSLVIPSMR